MEESLTCDISSDENRVSTNETDNFWIKEGEFTAEFIGAYSCSCSYVFPFYANNNSSLSFSLFYRFNPFIFLIAQMF